MRALLVLAYLLILALIAGFIVLGQPERAASSAAQGTSRFSIDRAMSDLMAIETLTHDSGGRQVGSTGNRRVREYLVKGFREAGLEVSEQPFRDMLGGSMSNVLAVLQGGGDEAILVSAHHDLEGRGPGAVGGTAGLAMLLELARCAAAEPVPVGVRRERTVIFAGWDGDSYGSAGSTHFVETLPAKERGRLRAVVSLDAVGWKGARAVLHAMPYTDRFGTRTVAPDWLLLRMTNAARAGGHLLPVGDLWIGPVYQVLVRAVDIGYYSDDRPFLARGVPAVFVGDFSLTRSYRKAGTGEDTLDQVGRREFEITGRSIEASIADLRTAPALPPGESDYLVVTPGFADAFRITGDQAKALGALCLLPGSLVLLRPRWADGLGATRALFLGFAALFVALMVMDPILAPALFVPVLLAAPLLAVRRPGAAWGHVASLLPAALFLVLLVPFWLSGSAALVRLARIEMAAIVALFALGLAQLPLHLARIRAARAALAP